MARTRQQARAGGRCKRNAHLHLWIVVAACPVPCIRQGIVEYILTLGVALQIGWYCAYHVITTLHQQMERLPAGLWRHAAAHFERVQKSVGQKGIVGTAAVAAVPDVSRSFVDVVQYAGRCVGQNAAVSRVYVAQYAARLDRCRQQRLGPG